MDPRRYCHQAIEYFVSITLTLTVPSEILGGLRVAPLMRGTIGLGKDDSRERDYQEFPR